MPQLLQKVSKTMGTEVLYKPSGVLAKEQWELRQVFVSQPKAPAQAVLSPAQSKGVPSNPVPHGNRDPLGIW